MDKRLALYKAVFNSPMGQAVLADLAQAAGQERSSYQADRPSEETFFREGKRALYLYILATLRQAKSPILLPDEVEENE